MALSSTLRSRNSCSTAEFRVECLTYAHSRAQPVPSLSSPGYDLLPTATIPARRLINIKRPSRLEPRTFLTGTCAATTRTPTVYRLSYGRLFLPLFVTFPTIYPEIQKKKTLRINTCCLPQRMRTGKVDTGRRVVPDYSLPLTRAGVK